MCNGHQHTAACSRHALTPTRAASDSEPWLYVILEGVADSLLGFSDWVLSVSKQWAQCQHSRAAMVEGKTYCPDCGEGIVYQWVTLRCGQCGRKRSATYAFREVVPLETCCRHCGEAEYEKVTLSDPDYYQLHWALLELQPEWSTIQPAAALTAAKKVWVEEPNIPKPIPTPSWIGEPPVKIRPRLAS